MDARLVCRRRPSGHHTPPASLSPRTRRSASCPDCKFPTDFLRMCQISKGERGQLLKEAPSHSPFRETSRKWRQGHSFGNRASEGNGLENCLRLPLEAVKHERKFPKEEPGNCPADLCKQPGCSVLWKEAGRMARLRATVPASSPTSLHTSALVFWLQPNSPGCTASQSVISHITQVTSSA